MSGSDMLGDGHRAVLNELSSTLESLCSGDSTAARIVVLEGHSGTGKSRVVRELYRRLQESQPNPGYWPEIAAGEATSRGGGRHPLAFRKKLGPSVDGFVWPPDSLPSFLWWTFNCDRMQHGDLIDAVAQARAEIEAHLIPASIAWREAAGWGERITASRSAILDRAREALSEGGFYAASAALAALHLTFPGLGLGVSWLWKAGGVLRSRSEENQMLASYVKLQQLAASARSSAAEELADLLVTSTHLKLPSVVVIEDLHLMGPELGELIDRLAIPRSDKPLLVIGTAWPEGRRNEAYASWRASAVHRRAIREIAIPDLKVVDRIRMLRRVAPRTSDVDAVKVVERYSNPLALQMMLSLEKVLRHIGNNQGALVLTEDQLLELPSGIEELYRHRWRELPEGLRRALMIAAGSLPSEGTTASWAFLLDVVAQAGGRWAHNSADTAASLATSLRQAEDPYLWLVNRGSPKMEVLAFRESILADIAVLSLRESYEETDIDILRSATTTALEDWIDREREDRYLLDTTDERKLVAARWLWALTSPSTTPTATISVAGFATADAKACSYRYGDAIATLTGRQWEAPLRPDFPDTIRIRAKFAEWVGQVGRVHEAIDRYERLVADCANLFGPDDPNGLAYRGNLAWLVGQAGWVQEAIGRLEKLDADFTRVVGPRHPDTLAARSNLAWFVGQSGRVRKAVGLYGTLVADSTNVLGADHLDTLTARNNLAGLLGEGGRPDEAVRRYETLIADFTRVVGPRHPNTMSARYNHARFVGETGSVGEAIRLYEALVRDSTELWGAEHPNTLAARYNYASFVGETGGLEDAIRLHEALLRDGTELLGAAHPDMLRVRNSHAKFLGDAGRLEEAIRLYETIVRDSLVVLGADHPTVLTIRANLARCLRETGQAAEAVARFEILVSDLTRAFGADHPTTLTIRGDLARALSSAGRLDEAIPLYEEVLHDCNRVLGRDHPLTLVTGGNLSGVISTMVPSDEAVSRHETLIAELTRVYGPDHQSTLAARNNHAFLIGTAGRVDEAIDLYKDILPEMARILGADHPTTLTGRYNLAGVLGKAGQRNEGIVCYEGFIADSTRVLGADHLTTLNARNNRAFLIGQAGRVDEAIDLYEDLLPDLTRVLRPNHVTVLTAQSNLSHLLCQAGRVQEAIGRLEQLVVDSTRLLGPTHVITVNLSRQLQHCRELGTATSL